MQQWWEYQVKKRKERKKIKKGTDTKNASLHTEFTQNRHQTPVQNTMKWTQRKSENERQNRKNGRKKGTKKNLYMYKLYNTQKTIFCVIFGKGTKANFAFIQRFFTLAS